MACDSLRSDPACVGFVAVARMIVMHCGNACAEPACIPATSRCAAARTTHESSTQRTQDCAAFPFRDETGMREIDDTVTSKVPEVTAMFWVIKILATTLGETAGDAASMSLGLGYLLGSMVFAAIFAIAVLAQIAAHDFRPWLYWLTIIATTTVGTTLADYATRSLGIGYAGGSAILLGLLLGSLWIWYRDCGSLAVASVRSPRAEIHYWVTIMFSQTLGTALGDWTATTAGLGFNGGALIFGVMLVAIAAAWRWSRISPTALFWSAFILTRPLGAVVGDLLDKPVAEGGLALSRYAASLSIIAVIALLVFLVPQRAARRVH